MSKRIKCASPSCAAAVGVNVEPLAPPMLVLRAVRALGWRVRIDEDGRPEYWCDRCTS